ncbi:predicted protein [Sclerotinia sclerotiorum 1980 UF-70]|uniref:Uncharacterized protein n=1 Tax=Sclerotinia sclerotiorum (strain ATCC 18683 / 1980 / Ss-1) TaxID=665079 RepID=A7EKP4_SCLS1|nr:predicted protein [Sclerotinia sclerotiorum 1980 UF-70]EDO03410.1 predicted protein [Sclerotinia sclerotiorum 1980 UF-70]
MAIVCRLVWHASSFPATFMTELKDKRMFEYKIKVSAFYPNTHASIYRFAAQPLLDSKHNAFAPWIDNHTGQAPVRQCEERNCGTDRRPFAVMAPKMKRHATSMIIGSMQFL